MQDSMKPNDAYDLLESLAIGDYPYDVFGCAREIADCRMKKLKFREEEETLNKIIEADLRNGRSYSSRLI